MVTTSIATPSSHWAPNQPTLTVHSYTSPENAFFVNSYIIETPTGLVVLDTQFLISQAHLLKARIEALGKPLRAIIISHPHPDHFNGLGTLLGINSISQLPQVPVYASAATLEGIKTSEGPKRVYWKPSYGEDYPDFTVLPTHLVTGGEVVTVDGIDFHFTNLGPGEASDMNLIALPAYRVLFCGDLVYHKVHPWLAESRSSAWLEQLALTLKTYPTVQTVYPGHGTPTTLVALNEQIAYINTLQLLVRRELASASTGNLSEEGKLRIKQVLQEQFPNQPLEMLHEANILGVATEVSGGPVSDPEAA